MTIVIVLFFFFILIGLPIGALVVQTREVRRFRRDELHALGARVPAILTHRF